MPAFVAVLRDVLAPESVFCGTAVSAASAARGAYYAVPRHAFWAASHAAGFPPRRLPSEAYPAVIQFIPGLTGSAKDVAGADHLPAREPFGRQAPRDKILHFRPGRLAFTRGRAAAELFGHAVAAGVLEATQRRTVPFALRSPSDTARRYWDLKPWQDWHGGVLGGRHGGSAGGALGVGWLERILDR